MVKIDFNKGWLFQKGETSFIEVSVPHDAVLTEERKADNPSGSGGAFFGRSDYTYKKSFEAPEEWRGKRISVLFEGIYKDAEIFLNEDKIGQTFYGYTEKRIDLGSFLKYGKENTIKVVIREIQCPDSRYYTGAGIYRPVFLEISDEVHILPESVKIKTVSVVPPTIEVNAQATDGEIRFQLWDGKQLIADQALVSGQEKIEIPEAELWSAENPKLYQCKLLLNQDGSIADTWEQNIGIRKLEWNAEGFFVNGENTLLRGGCVHSDNGILGAASYDEAEWRRVRILKQAGFNAIRCAHNPCARAMLDACDYYGMYVIDETWDAWYLYKSKYDYANEFEEHYEEDLRAMAAKDYNHPSVIAYSIGNEVSEPASEKGMELAKTLKALIRELDDTRIVTAGINLMIVTQAAKGQQMYGENGQAQHPRDMSGMDSARFNQIAQSVGTSMNHAADSEEADLATSPILDLLDVAGYNYASGRYDLEGEKHPERIIVGSETFPQDIAKNWNMVKQYPYLIGDFMWTAWDYLGETGAGAWAYTDDAKAFAKPYPWLLSDAGAIDILGNPTGEAFHAQAVWNYGKSLHLAVQPVNHPGETIIKSTWRGTNSIPAWSYRNCDGNDAVVEIYSSQNEVELFVNQKSMGRKNPQDCKAEYVIAYEPGELMAVEYDKQGEMLDKVSLKSAEGKNHIRVAKEEKCIQDSEIVYLRIDICGENNIVENNADEKLTVETDGAVLLGFGSANPRTEENYLSGEFTTYYGHAQAIVRKTCPVAKITVKGETLEQQEYRF